MRYYISTVFIIKNTLHYSIEIHHAFGIVISRKSTECFVIFIIAVELVSVSDRSRKAVIDFLKMPIPTTCMSFFTTGSSVLNLLFLVYRKSPLIAISQLHINFR